MFLKFKWKTNTFVVSEQFSHSHLSLITYFFFFFTNHGGIRAELITITKTSLLNELLHKTVQEEVKVRYEHISVARKQLIFEYFSVKLCQMFFEINKLNLVVLDGASFYKKYFLVRRLKLKFGVSKFRQMKTKN